MIRRLLFAVTFPLALVFVARWLAETHDFSGPWVLVRQYGTVFGLLVALILSWGFNQTRVLFALLALGLATVALHDGTWPRLAFLPDAAETTYLVVAHLLPINLILFPLLKERGLFTGRGIARLAFVLAQPICSLYLAQWFPDQLASWLQRPWWPSPEHLVTPIPQSAVLLFLVAGLVVIFSLVRGETAVGMGFLGTLGGALAVLHDPGSPATGQLVVFAASLSTLFGVILRSYQMAYRDELTGLPGRRALREQLQKLGGRYSIAMVDIDHFKKFNDRHGHDVGDQVLRMVASQLAKAKGGGKAFRYGGEEFTLLFSGKLSQEAEALAEALRRRIAAARFRLRSSSRPRKKPASAPKKAGRAVARAAAPKELRVTVSVGLADSAGADSTQHQVLENADKALYRAKRKGRNRVER